MCVRVCVLVCVCGMCVWYVGVVCVYVPWCVKGKYLVNLFFHNFR